MKVEGRMEKMPRMESSVKGRDGRWKMAEDGILVK
jgi:hypothetical protein